MVLDKGEVREYDTPSRLLENKAGIFYSLTKEAGITRAEIPTPAAQWSLK